MIDCFIIDDDPQIIELLRSYAEQISDLQLLFTSSSPLDSLHEIKQLRSPSIAFLDIEMPSINGLSFSELLGHNFATVFITGHPEYATTAFEKNAVDYLLKPVSFERFLQAYLKASQWIKLRKDYQPDPRERYLFLSDPKGRQKVYLHQISYVESMGNYIRIYLAEEILIQRSTFSQFLKRIDSPNFLQIHKSYIINLDHFKRIEYNILSLDNGTQIPLGKTFREAILKATGQGNLPGHQD